MPSATPERIQANQWIRANAQNIKGRVLSLGSGGDLDNEGNKYRNYFKQAESYQTSDISLTAPVNLVLDVRNMEGIEDGSYDCIFASGLLEHVDDLWSAVREINRVLTPGGIFLFGSPFGHRIHRAPQDFWRMTIHGVQYLMDRNSFVIEDVLTINGPYGKTFPAGYWVRAIKTRNPSR